MQRLEGGLVTDCDVAIVGCGPVGAVAANLLAAEGLRVRVFEAAAEIFDKPRAIGMDHEGMRIVQACGVAETFAKTIRPYGGGNWLGVDGELIAHFDPVPPPYALGWPPNFTFVQPTLETLLRTALAKRANVQLELGRRVAMLEQTPDVVELRVESGAGFETVRTSYVIACDGARSTVRELLDMDLKDLAFDEWWVVVDAYLRRPATLPAKNTQYCWPSRPTTFIHGPDDLRRWEMKILPGENPETFRNEEAVLRALSAVVDTKALDIWRTGVYRFHALVADRWRVGRVFLAGDAAHQTPPFMGQGLCAGLRDAANLAWKLAMAQRGFAADGLLDTYQAEREPHVTSIIKTAIEFGRQIGDLDAESAQRRDARLRQAIASGERSTRRQRFIPPLLDGVVDVEKGEALSPLAGMPFVQPTVLVDGEPVLLDSALGKGFWLVAAATAVQQWLGDALADWWQTMGGERVVVLAAGAGNGAPASAGKTLMETGEVFANLLAEHGVEAVVVRPDRYVYGAARDAEELRRLVAGLRQQLGNERKER